MSFFDKLKNSSFVKWLTEIFRIKRQVLIPATITTEETAEQSLSEKSNTPIIEATSEPRRLNKFEQFQEEITNSTYYKSLTEKNQIRYLNTVKKLYVCLGGRIPRKQPFVLRSILEWHNSRKIEHFSNITENWTYEYSSEFEKYISKYKDALANNIMNFDTKTALDHLQANPKQIDLNIFPPILKADTAQEEVDLNQIIKPSTYKPKEENLSNYLYEHDTAPAEDAIEFQEQHLEQLFNELFISVNEHEQEPIQQMSTTELEELFDQIFCTTTKKDYNDVPLELLNQTPNNLSINKANIN